MPRSPQWRGGSGLARQVMESLGGLWEAVGDVSGEQERESFFLDADAETLPDRSTKVIAVSGYSQPRGEFELNGELVQAAVGEWELELEQVYLNGSGHEYAESEDVTRWSAEFVVDERGASQLVNGQWQFPDGHGDFKATRLSTSARSSSDPDDEPDDPSIASPGKHGRTPAELYRHPLDIESEEEDWEEELLDGPQEEPQGVRDTSAQIDMLEVEIDQILEEEREVARRGGRSLHVADKLRVARANIAERILQLEDSRQRAWDRHEKALQRAWDGRAKLKTLKKNYHQLKREGGYEAAHEVWQKIQKVSTPWLKGLTTPQRLDNEGRRGNRAWRQLQAERGQLSAVQISKGQTVLMQLRTALMKQNRADLRRLSKEFYRLVPDTERRQQPPLLDNERILREKEKMLAKKQMDLELDTLSEKLKDREAVALQDRKRNRLYDCQWRPSTRALARNVDEANFGCREDWELRLESAEARRDVMQAERRQQRLEDRQRRLRQQNVHGGYHGAFADSGPYIELQRLTLTELRDTAIEGAGFSSKNVDHAIDTAIDQGSNPKDELIEMIHYARSEKALADAAFRGGDVPLVHADPGYRPCTHNRWVEDPTRQPSRSPAGLRSPMAAPPRARKWYTSG